MKIELKISDSIFAFVSLKFFFIIINYILIQMQKNLVKFFLDKALAKMGNFVLFIKN